MTEVRIYFEGDTSLRPGFHAFLKAVYDAARPKGISVKLVATGSQPIRDYCMALKSHPSSANYVLLDTDRTDDGTLLDSIRDHNDCSRGYRLL